MEHRPKGIALVETPKGILLVAKKDRFGLPGGGANPGETKEQAAIRELKEETGLEVKSLKYLFDDIDPEWIDRKGRTIKNHSKVFLAEVSGTPRPSGEIRHMEFWKPGSKLLLKDSAVRILSKYLKRT